MRNFSALPMLVALCAGGLFTIANADTLTYNANIAPQSGPINGFKIPGIHQFDSSLGTLNSATLKFRTAFDAKGHVFGKGKSFQYHWVAKYALGGPQGTVFEGYDEEKNQTIKLTGNDIPTYDGLYPRDANGLPKWNSKSFKGSDELKPFMGTGDLPIAFYANSGFQHDDSDGKYELYGAYYSGDATVSYDYTPSSPKYKVTRLGTSEVRYGFASANQKGIVTGAIKDGGNPWQPALFKAGKPISIGPKFKLDAPSMWLTNDGFGILRVNITDNRSMAYLWKESDTKPIIPEGYKFLDPHGATLDGAIIGQGYQGTDPAESGQPFLYSGKFFPIQVAGLKGIQAQAINSKHTIVITGRDEKGNATVGTWQDGNFRALITEKNVIGWAINEKGHVAVSDDQGRIIIFTENSKSVIAAPGGTTIEISSLREDDSVAGTVHAQKSDATFIGDAKGIVYLDELAGNTKKFHFQMGWYVQNNGALVALNAVDGSFYTIKVAKPVKANLALAKKLVGGVKYKVVIDLNRAVEEDTNYVLKYDQKLISAPEAVTVMQGQTEAVINIKANEVLKAADTTITASSEEDTATAQTTVVPFSVGTLTPSVSYLPEGQVTTMVLHLPAPAPDGGILVKLRADHPEFASIPDSVNVPAGSQDVKFDAQTFGVDQNQRVIVSAWFLIDRITGTFTVKPLRITGFGGDTTVSKAGATVNFKVGIEAPAPANGRVVTIASNSNSINLPKQVLIPAGQTVATFTGTVTGKKHEVFKVTTSTPDNSLYWQLTIN